jgi:acyl carrier protein
MEKDNILKQLNEIFIDTLENDSIVLTEETTAKDVDEWESLNHVQLVVAIEKRFKIRFNAREIQGWKNVGEIIECIQSKI